MIDASSGNIYYYHTDVLGGIVALTNSSGSVVERYSYDVYGAPTMRDANDQILTASDFGNCRMFTGRNVDFLDSGNLKLQYNRNRYYDCETGRWLTQDPLGIVPNAQWPNVFYSAIQYKDTLNLYEYVKSNPIGHVDTFGLGEWDFAEPPTPGREGDWDPFRAAWHFAFGNGETVMFNHQSDFAKYVSSHSGIANALKLAFMRLDGEVVTYAAGMEMGTSILTDFAGYAGAYDFTGDFKGMGTLGSGGGNDSYSQFRFYAHCRLKKHCLGNNPVIDVKCKVLFRLGDKYSYDSWPWIPGTPFWTTIFFYKDYGLKQFNVPCN
jgi:RHS repeat-associated protein